VKLANGYVKFLPVKVLPEEKFSCGKLYLLKFSTLTDPNTPFHNRITATFAKGLRAP
jgi:hypothetical protein